jgi:antitoxin (DNA-binding transcriptional repressor) of toxin-antitoxin stability system
VQVIGAYEAKTKLSELLTQVSRGESFTITKHGMPVAILTRPVGQGNANVEETIEAIRRQRQQLAHAFDGESVKRLIEEGRK